MKDQWKKYLTVLGSNSTIKCIQGVKNPSEYYKQFDITIFDEIHLYMTPVFVKNVVWCDTKYIIGLSATPVSKYNHGGCISPFQQFRDVYKVEYTNISSDYSRFLEIMYIDDEVDVSIN